MRKVLFFIFLLPVALFAQAVPIVYRIPVSLHTPSNIVNSSVSIDLGDVATLLPRDANGEINGKYKLKFTVTNNVYWYPSPYTATLNVANAATTYGAALCSASGWGMGDPEEVIIICPSQRVFGELWFSFSSYGPTDSAGNVASWGVSVDNVSLTFTPQS